jgi:hypothetical protein
MTDEQRLQIITEQLILVRDNLFRGMSKSIQKLQARSINEVLELPNHTQSPPTQQEPVAKDNSNYRLDQPGLDPLYTSPQTQRTWVGLTDDEIELLEELYAPPVHPDFVDDADHCFSLIKKVEAKLKERNQ